MFAVSLAYTSCKQANGSTIKKEESKVITYEVITSEGKVYNTRNVVEDSSGCITFLAKVGCGCAAKTRSIKACGSYTIITKED